MAGEMSILIDSNERRSYVPARSIQVENVLTRQIDTARFQVLDGGALGLAELDELIISDADTGTRYFAGFVESLVESQEGVRLDYEVGAVDYTFLLEHPVELVNYEYESKSDQEMIQDFMADSCPDIDVTTYVQELRTFTRFRFVRQTPRQALDRLAAATGADWYVDYGPAGAKKAYLHYFEPHSYSAPFVLSDSPDGSSSYAYQDLERQVRAPAANVVTVVGGYYLSDDQELILSADGVATKILVPYRLRKPTTEDKVQVYRNDGTDGTPSWTSLNLGTGYLHELTDYDALLYFQEKHLEFATAPPNLTKAIKVEARYEIPVRVRARNEVSYALYGRWMETVIVDNQIQSKDVAKQRARAYLAQEAVGQPWFRLRTQEAGLAAGQQLRLVSGRRSIDNEYLVQRVMTRFLYANRAEYDVELGLYNADLVDLIVALKRQEQPRWSDEERLDELFELEDDLDLADTASSEARGPDYYWGSHSPSEEEMKWGFFTWG